MILFWAEAALGGSGEGRWGSFGVGKSRGEARVFCGGVWAWRTADVA